MSETTPLEDARVELTATMEERERAAPDRDERFRILVLGDFTGRESREIHDPTDLGASRTPVRVDRDTIEDLPGELGTKVRVQLLEHGAPLTFVIRSFEDFHPDRLFAETHPFAGLRKTRVGLESSDSREYREASAEVASWGISSAVLASSGAPALPPPSRPTPAWGPEPIPMYKAGRRIDRGTPTEDEAFTQELLESAKKRETTEDVQSLARQAVAGHVAPRPPADRDRLVASADAVIGSWMRTLLHEPLFHDLEAAWRSLDLLVRRADEDTTEVHVLDITRAELGEDLRRRELSTSGLHRMLVADAAETSGGRPWSVVVGLWPFSATVEDAALLGRMARVAQAAGAPFLAAASPRLAGRDSFMERDGRVGRTEDGWPDETEEALWQALRGMPGAEWIGLALPRILLRLPYGAGTDPTEEFKFEEDEDGGHEDLLWGSPAAACALLLAQAFARDGWDMAPGSVRDVDDLPLYVRIEGEAGKLTPCAETALTDTEVEDLLDNGLMPFVSRRESDTVRLARFQSIRDPLTPLAGPWST